MPVDGPVDGLVGHLGAKAVDAPGELDRDRHGRVLRSQSGHDVAGQHGICNEYRDFRAHTVAVRTGLGSVSLVAGSAPVGPDLFGDRRAMSAESSGGIGKGLRTLDPGPDLFALGINGTAGMMGAPLVGGRVSTAGIMPAITLRPVEPQLSTC
jgi:hypothetical protein